MKPYRAREGNKQIKLAGFQNQHRCIAILTSIASTDRGTNFLGTINSKTLQCFMQSLLNNHEGMQDSEKKAMMSKNKPVPLLYHLCAHLDLPFHQQRTI